MLRKSKRHEEHTPHEAWAIPYGDLITLLLAFFVVMYALSSVNEGKYRLLSDSLYAAFRGTPRTLEPVQAGEHQAGLGADSRTGILQQQNPQGRSSPPPVTPVKLAADAPAVSAPAAVPASTPESDASLSRVADQVERALADLVQRNVVLVRRTDQWVEVEIRTDILFPSGSARLAPSAVTVLEQLAQVLAPLPNAVRVEGHTDNVPIRNAAFYSNWELSAARAGSVVRVLSAHGVAPIRLAVVGFGEQRPLQSNDTPEGRNANRRVVVVILRVDPAHPNDPLNMLRTPTGSPAVAPPATAAPADASSTAAPVNASPAGATPVPPPAAAVPGAAPPPIARPAATTGGGG